MAVLKILTNPNPILRQKSQEISKKDLSQKDMVIFCNSMIKAMKANDGVGLAAPQVGKNIRLIIVDTPEHGPTAMINPKIIKKSWAREWGEEGCLSCPNVFGEVNRHKKVTCTFIKPDGKTSKVEAVALTARAIQHEIDHLDGILFIDKAKNIKVILNDE